jgi:NAD(P)H dehydrogenase (quinone)
VAQARELPDYDAIVFGTPMRHGRLATQLANFMDRSDEISTRGALVGKVGSVFCSPADQLDAPETTLTAFYTNLLHHGMVVVGLPYAAAWLLPQGEIRDAGEPQRERRRNEFELARFQGRHVAEIVARLAAHSGGREPVGFHAAVPWL